MCILGGSKCSRGRGKEQIDRNLTRLQVSVLHKWGDNVVSTNESAFCTCEVLEIRHRGSKSGDLLTIGEFRCVPGLIGTKCCFYRNRLSKSHKLERLMQVSAPLLSSDSLPGKWLWMWPRLSPWRSDWWEPWIGHHSERHQIFQRQLSSILWGVISGLYHRTVFRALPKWHLLLEGAKSPF